MGEKRQETAIGRFGASNLFYSHGIDQQYRQDRQYRGREWHYTRSKLMQNSELTEQD
jgi:hypothetical protein